MSYKEMTNKVVDFFCDNGISFTTLDVSNIVKKAGFPGVRHSDVAEIIRQEFSEGYLADYYDRSIIDIELSNGTTAQTFLYHDRDVSPDDYIDRKQVPVMPTTAEATPKTRVINTAGEMIEKVNRIEDLMEPEKIGRIEDLMDEEEVRAEKVNKIEDLMDDEEDEWDEDEDEGDAVLAQEKRSPNADGRLEIPAEWVKDFGWRDDVNRLNYERRICILATETGLRLTSPGSVGPDDNVIMTTVITPDGRIRVPKSALIRTGMGDYDNYYIYKGEDSIFVEPDYPSTSTFTF